MIQLGSVIKNRYKIVRLIGKGGFGETFEVDDRGRRKVLKVLRHFSDPKEQKKPLCLFQREAEVLMKLNRPGIPKVEPDGCLTWQEGSNTRYGFVMEKIDGKSLDKWLEERGDTITEADAIDWLKQLLLILEYVHDEGYIHRDIKPSNIMVKPNNQLVLIDWGTVKEITSTYLVKVVEEIPATKLMSPGYTPLEQIQGKPVPPSDFFALGRTFVYLLTGKEPGEFPEDYLTEQLIWRNQAPTVSESLGDLIDRMMRVFPRERPKNTQEIWQRIGEINPDSSASKLGLQHPFEKWRESWLPRIKWRNSVNLGVAGLLLVGAIAFPVVAPEIAVFCNDQGLENYVHNRLGIAKLFYKCAIALQSKYAKPHYNLGSLYESQEKFDLAMIEYQSAIELRPNFAAAYNNLARLQILQHQKYEESVGLLQKSLQFPQSEETKYALHKNLGWTRLKQGRYQEAKVYLQRAIKLNPERAVAYCLLARLREKEGSNSNAEWESCQRYAPNDNSTEVDAWIRLR